MSAPRIKVSMFWGGFVWYCRDEECEALASEDATESLLDAWYLTIDGAATAGSKHLLDAHLLPRLRERPTAAKYDRDTTPDWDYVRSQADNAPRVRYCRPHGVSRSECECVVQDAYDTSRSDT